MIIKRNKITIKNGEVPGSQINGTVLFNDIYPHLIHAKNLGFTDETGCAVLQSDIINFDNATGKLKAICYLPILEDGASFYMTYTI